MRKSNLFTLLGALAVPVVAFAGDVVEAEGHGGGWSPFQGDVGNAIWTVVIFVLLLWVLGRYAWGPLLKGLQGREEFIAGALRAAADDRDRAAAQLREYEGKLATARDQVEAMLDEARRDAAALREREETRAKDEARQIVERARREIEIATDTAVKELYDRAAALATQAAGRILERELDPRDHERLVADAIAALDRPGQGAH